LAVLGSQSWMTQGRKKLSVEFEKNVQEKELAGQTGI